MSLKSKITNWLQEIFKNKTIEEKDWCLEGSSDLGDGYSSDIYFIKLSIENKTLDLVLKCDKEVKTWNETFSMGAIFQSEINAYQQVIPKLLEFQKSKNLEEFQSIPKFYGSVCTKDNKIILMENVKVQGYTMASSDKFLHPSTIECALKAYGKFHAISFAFKHQNFDKFSEICSTIDNTLFGKVWENSGLMEVNRDNLVQCQDILRENGVKEDLVKKLDKLVSYNFSKEGHILPESPNSVILHGDCWLNNFLFQFENNDESKCKNVKILDWQLSRLGCPPMDISYFLFATTSPADLLNLKHFLKVYHDSLSEQMKLFGCDAEKIYSFADLMKDWKENGKFGSWLYPLIASVAAIKKEEKLDLCNMVENGKTLKDTFGVKKDNQEFVDRILAMMTNPEFQNLL